MEHLGVSIAITVLVLVVATMLAVKGSASVREGLSIEGDALQRSFLSLPPDAAAILAGFVWLTYAFAVSVILPGSSGAAYFKTAHGLLVTLNYAFIVPLLVGLSVALLSAMTQTLTKDAAQELGLVRRQPTENWLASLFAFFRNTEKRKRAYLLWLLLLAPLVVMIQVDAIDAEIAHGSKESPWVEYPESQNEPSNQAALETRTLTQAGSYYYSFRGLSSSMAIGLILALILAFFRLYVAMDQSKTGTRFVDATFRVKQPVQRLARALLLTSFVGALVVFAHGVSLMAEAAGAGGTLECIGTPTCFEGMRDALFESRWAYWFFAVLLASFAGIATAFRLQHFLVLEKGRMELRNAELLASGLESEDADRHEQTVSAMTAYRVELKRARLLGEPIYSSAVVTLAFGAQALNVLLPVFSIVYGSS